MAAGTAAAQAAAHEVPGAAVPAAVVGAARSPPGPLPPAAAGVAAAAPVVVVCAAAGAAAGAGAWCSPRTPAAAGAAAWCSPRTPAAAGAGAGAWCSPRTPAAAGPGVASVVVVRAPAWCSRRTAPGAPPLRAAAGAGAPFINIAVAAGEAACGTARQVWRGAAAPLVIAEEGHGGPRIHCRGCGREPPGCGVCRGGQIAGTRGSRAPADRGAAISCIEKNRGWVAAHNT